MATLSLKCSNKNKIMNNECKIMLARHEMFAHTSVRNTSVVARLFVRSLLYSYIVGYHVGVHSSLYLVKCLVVVVIQQTSVVSPGVSSIITAPHRITKHQLLSQVSLLKPTGGVLVSHNEASYNQSTNSNELQT